MKIKQTWAEAWTPYYNALRKLKLPKRRKRGSRRNFERSMMVVRTLHRLKAKIKGFKPVL